MQLLGYPINAHYVTAPEPRPLNTQALAHWISLDLAERASHLRHRGNGAIYDLPNGERIIITALGRGMVSMKNELTLGMSAFVRRGILRRDRRKVAQHLERILVNLHQEVPITPKRHQDR